MAASQAATRSNSTAPDLSEFVISRVFDAPRELVFSAFTDAERMRQWWGPKGFTVIHSKMDLRPGGTYHYGMRAPDGTPMWGKFVYREIVRPERIVAVTSFADEAGEIGRHPMAPTWPLKMLLTFLFEEGRGGTKLTIRWSPLDADETEAATFAEGHASMQQGWTGTLDQLADYVAKARAGTTEEGEMPCKAEPQKEHAWLHRLVGEWSFEGECMMGPDQPPMKSTGSETVRSLGGLWTIGEGEGEMPGGGAMRSIMTLGYDPQKGRFVGTFVASMMTHMWVYDGALDDAGKVLTLDTEGPSFKGDGRMVKYQDIIAFESDDRRTLRSRALGEDGTWGPFFMTANYRRKK